MSELVRLPPSPCPCGCGARQIVLTPEQERKLNEFLRRIAEPPRPTS